MSEGLID